MLRLRLFPPQYAVCWLLTTNFSYVCSNTLTRQIITSHARRCKIRNTDYMKAACMVRELTEVCTSTSCRTTAIWVKYQVYRESWGRRLLASKHGCKQRRIVNPTCLVMSKLNMICEKQWSGPLTCWPLFLYTFKQPNSVILPHSDLFFLTWLKASDISCHWHQTQILHLNSVDLNFHLPRTFSLTSTASQSW